MLRVRDYAWKLTGVDLFKINGLGSLRSVQIRRPSTSRARNQFATKGDGRCVLYSIGESRWAPCC